MIGSESQEPSRKDMDDRFLQNPESELRPTDQGMYVQRQVEQEVQAALREAGISPELVAALPISSAPDGKEGDFGIPCFTLSKELRMSPVVIAQQLAEKLNATVDQQKYIARYIAVGPYLNFELRLANYAPAVVSQVLEQGADYGKEDVGHNERVVIDMSSPNIAKRMSIGHLRSTIIGDSLAKSYSALGYEVIRDNHIGDWGTQFGHLLHAIQLWGDEAAIEQDPINELQKLYVRISAEGEKDEAVKDAGRAWFKKLEQGDPEARRIWKKIVDWSLQDFQKIYDILKVDFDIRLGESFYEPMLNDTIREVEESGQAEISKGALVFNLEAEGLGVAIVRKSDGATLYMTRDLAGARYRQNEMQAERMIYVVGEDQKQYFQQLFAALKRLGYPIAEKSVHVYFGMVRLPEDENSEGEAAEKANPAEGKKPKKSKKMSTRKGRVILLENVIDEANVRARGMISEKTQITDPAEQDRLVQQVAIGALKYNDLKGDPRGQIVFDWDDILNLKGNSAPYLQYSHARAATILEKSGGDINPSEILPTQPSEVAILKELAEFPTVLRKLVETNTPAVMANYLYSLAQRFNAFYHELTILGGNEQERNTRVAISAAVAQTVRNGLYYLGIEAPNKM